MDVIQDVGAYAGFAAVVGLAVLAALYFSQARDVRRLREWAGRAPERAAEQAEGAGTPEQAAQDAARPAPSGAVRPIPAVKPAGAQKPEPGAKPEPGPTPAPGATPAPAAQPGKGPAPVGKPATAAATASAPATATASGPAPATPAGAPAKAKPGEPAKAPDGAPVAKPDGGPAAKPDGGPEPSKAPEGPKAPEAPKPAPVTGGPPPATPPPRPASPPVLPARPAPPVRSPAAASSQSTAVLPASTARLRDRGRGTREGLSPRYIALIVAGVIVIGGGAVFGISQLGGDDEATTSGDQTAAPQEPVNPSFVTVSVLNGTTVPGLAAQIGDEIEAAGFQRGNVANALDQQRTTSTVLFAAGKEREARVVARKLDIATVEPVDPDSAALGGNASVVVIVGADQTS